MKSCVLVVDDDVDVRAILAARLSRLGVRVVTAADGRAGLDAVERYQPRCVLLDIMMPAMDGFDFLAALRARANEGPAVYVMSQVDDPTYFEQACRLGARRAMSKAEVLSRDFAVGLQRELSEMRIAA